jgi:hypothetical protein
LNFRHISQNAQKFLTENIILLVELEELLCLLQTRLHLLQVIRVKIINESFQRKKTHELVIKYFKKIIKENKEEQT